MTLDEAIGKLCHYWYVGMGDYFTEKELQDLIAMLQELAEYRGLQEKILEERSLEIEREDWEREE
jgi:hypothetical protein